MSDLINFRIKIITIDNRTYLGTLLSFDKHMNLVLSDTEESRITKKSYSQLKKHTPNVEPVYDKRNLGLIILRGDQVVSFTIESNAPLTDVKSRLDRPIKKPVSRMKKSLHEYIKHIMYTAFTSAISINITRNVAT